MEKKHTEKFDLVYDILMEINHSSIKDGDDDAKSLSCFLIETMDKKMDEFGI